MQPNGSIRGVRMHENCSSLSVLSSSSYSSISLSFRKPLKRKSK